MNCTRAGITLSPQRTESTASDFVFVVVWPMTHISHDYQPAPAPLVKVSGHNNKSMPHCALQQVRNAFCPIFFFVMPERCIAGDDDTKVKQHAHVLRNSRGPSSISATLAVGKCFLVLHVQYTIFLVFFETHQPNHCILFSTGASTPVICPMFCRCIRSFSCLVWRLPTLFDLALSGLHLFLRVLGVIVGTLGLSLLSCDSLQIEFICVHWNFVRKHLASQLCRRLLRPFVTPLTQPMAPSSARLTYSMRCQRRVFTDACTMNVCWRPPFGGNAIFTNTSLAHSQRHNSTVR